MSYKDPLTPEEVQKAADQFFPLFEVVLREMPEGSTTEDTLKVMETICQLAHKLRNDDDESQPFGFNKDNESGNS